MGFQAGYFHASRNIIKTALEREEEGKIWMKIFTRLGEKCCRITARLLITLIKVDKILQKNRNDEDYDNSREFQLIRQISSTEGKGQTGAIKPKLITAAGRGDKQL